MALLYDTSGNPVAAWSTSGARVLGKPDPPPGTGTDPELLTTFRQIANNTGYHRGVTEVPSSGVSIQTAHDVALPGKGLVVQYTCIRIAGGVKVTVPTVIRRALIIDATGTAHPALFGGSQSVTVQPGEMVRSDPTGDRLVVEPGQRIHTVIELESGVYGSASFQGPGDSIKAVTGGPFTGTISKSLNDRLAGAPTGLYANTLATGRLPSIVGLGDSFMELGWFRIAAESHGMAWSDWSVWLDHTHVSRDPALDPALLDRVPASGPIPYDSAFIGWGGNDRTLGYDRWLGRTIESWRLFEEMGCKIATKTLHPYTNSTDKWATIASQTLKAPDTEPDRIARNEWLRDGAPMLPDDTPLPTGTGDPSALRIGDELHPVKYPVFDEADTCESSRNSGFWKVDGGSWTTDGAHLTVHGNARMADAFTKWVADNLT